MNFYTKFPGNPSNSCCYIQLKTSMSWWSQRKSKHSTEGVEVIHALSQCPSFFWYCIVKYSSTHSDLFAIECLSIPCYLKALPKINQACCVTYPLILSKEIAKSAIITNQLSNICCKKGTYMGLNDLQYCVVGRILPLVFHSVAQCQQLNK